MILHIATSNTFTRPYFSFIERRFQLSDHQVLSWATSDEWPEQLGLNAHHGTWWRWLLAFYNLSRRADKIIFHNLNNPRIAFMLFLNPWVLKKCYWLIWGSDLYAYKFEKRFFKRSIKEFFRRPVIRKFGHLVSYVPGDVDLARAWYGARGQFHQCLLYTSYLFSPESQDGNVKSGCMNILVGNSGDPSNRHVEVFSKLIKYKDENIKIFAPLSYGGTKRYLDQVCAEGRRIFGEKFTPIIDFMSRGTYQDFLRNVDIAIFYHRRQQAMGNIINLIGLGKKVYMFRGTSLWDLFESMGLSIFDADDLNVAEVSDKLIRHNVGIVREKFTEDEMARQYKTLFYG